MGEQWSMDSDPRTDGALLRSFRERGDRGALSLLFERHRARAYRVALSVLHRPSDAEDAVQDAFLNLLAYSDRARPEECLSGLVARMALRAAQRLSRASGRRGVREALWADEQPTAIEGTLDTVVSREVQRAVRDAVQSLDERYRIPVLLYYFEGFSTRETAEVLGLTQSAVTTRLSRAVEKLRRSLGGRQGLVEVPALLALLGAGRSEAASPSLAARLADVAARAPLTSAAPAAPLGLAAGGGLAAKLAAGALVVGVSLGGITAVRRLPPPPGAGAAGAVVPSAARGADHERGNIPAAAPSADRPAGQASERQGSVAALGRGSEDAALRSERSPLKGLSDQVRRGRSKHSLSSSGPISQPQRVSRAPVRVAAAGPTRPQAAEPAAVSAPGASPASGHTPLAPIARMPLAEQRRLGLSLLERAWRDARAAGVGSSEILTALARIDVNWGYALAATLPAAEKPAARQAILQQTARTDPQEVARWLDVSTHEDATSAPLFVLLDVGHRLTPDDQQTAQRFLDRAVKAMQSRPSTWGDILAWARVAALARELDDPRADGLIAETLKLVSGREAEAVKAEAEDDGRLRGRILPDVYGYAARQLAAADPPAAQALLARIPDARERFSQAMLMVRSLASYDVALAHRLLQENRPSEEGIAQERERNWALAARTVAYRLARRDPAAVDALAHQIRDPGYRIDALAMAARYAPPERAAALYEEAMDTVRDVSRHEGLVTVAARLAEAMPVGPYRRAACALALEELRRTGWTTGPRLIGGTDLVPLEGAAHIAFALGPIDPEAARDLLEEARRHASVPGERNPEWPNERMGRSGRSADALIAAALAAIDPGRAVDLALALPVAPAGPRLDTLRRVGEYLGAGPEARADYRFESGSIDEDENYR